METIAELIKRIPTLSWCVLSMCLLTYTGTLCVVMIRSSEVNVTVNGMTMAMTKAVDVQETAAADLEAAGKLITSLKAKITTLEKELVVASANRTWTPEIPFQVQSPVLPQPVPVVQIPIEHEYQTKAAGIRKNAAQMQQQVKQAAPMLAPAAKE